MPEIKLPSPQFVASSGFSAVAAGRLYIGVVNTDPRVEANRLTVTIIDTDGSSVNIPAASQPFLLNSAGMITFNGSVVQARVTENYSLDLRENDNGVDGPLVYFFPNANITADVSTSLIKLSATVTPSSIVGTGQLYTKSSGGGIEFFYLDADGNEVQFTSNGALNVDLPNNDVTVNSMTSGFYRGSVIALASVNNAVTLDWTVGQYFTLTNTETTTITFVNAPLINDDIGQTIALMIQDAGDFAITLSPESGFTIHVRSIDNPFTLTVGGLDVIFLTVYASGIVLATPLYNYVVLGS